MSGHSHWKTIKHKKGVADAKKGKFFSKLSRLITATAKQGGMDPSFNPKLKLAIEQARSFSMPNDNIEKALKRAAGGGETENFEELLFEGFGPENSALLIFALTNNKNRTFGEIRKTMINLGGKLGETGSVKWLFDQVGAIYISREKNPGLSFEEVEIKAIDRGALDIDTKDNTLRVFTALADFELIKDGFLGDGIVLESSAIEWVAKNSVQVPREKQKVIKKLIDELDELEDVQDIYTNTTFDN